MARPRKEQGEKRDGVLRTRVTTAEKAFVEAQASKAGLRPSDYLRKRVLGHVVAPPPERADAALIHELNAIGNNVNQLTRAVHRSGAFPDHWADHWQGVSQELVRMLDKVADRYGA